MRNWFTELRELLKRGSREEIPAPERLQPFADFLGRPEAECLIMAWLCMNHKKGDAQAIGQLFEQLGPKAIPRRKDPQLELLQQRGLIYMRAVCKTPDQMRLANGLCHYEEKSIIP